MVLPTIGRYRIIAQLGAGGMAEVYLAVMMGQRGFNKLVVLKVPRSNVAANPGLLAMFIDEARVAARLNHPNVVQTYEVVREEERDIIVMEYLDGYPLSKIIGQGRKLGTPLPLWMHYEVLIHAMTGLHYAHEAKDFDGSPLNLVHRDISPHNIFVTFDRQVKILDFGIAKARTSTHQTEVGTFKGKVRYMPPEQLTGNSIDRRSDIFALGVAIWEAAVGEPLWRGKSDIEVMGATLAGEVPMPRDVRPDVPEAIDAICRKAMAHRKEDRYPSCLELQADLEAYLASLTGTKGLKPIVGYMQMLFAEPRAERQTLIDKQLAKAELLGTGEFATLGASSGTSPGASIPLISTVARDASDPQMPVGPSLYPDLASSSGATMSRSRVVLQQGKPNRMFAFLFLGVLLFAGLVGVWLVALRKPEPVADNGTKPVAAGVQEAPTKSAMEAMTQEPSAQKVTIFVRGEPSSAKLFLDDSPTPLETNARAVSLTRNSVHTVRGEAKGYVTRAVTVTLDADKEVLVILEKEKPDTPWRPPPQPARGGKTLAAPAPKETAAVEPRPSTTEPNGYLTIDTYPWTLVSENGKSLGQTPIVRLPLPPGDHVLVLENPEQGLKQTYPVTIKSNETLNRRLGLK
ncbi:protein kinase domain-containing protein [Pendulispora albinea]|uniref:Protein kinase n=1 Tax=Pendulispora albinea TaxID=2741071 RepID=A0ABZ2MC69_9BACT